jgi:hypothetical protein
MSLAMSLLADLVIARNQHPLNKYEAPLAVPIDKRWSVWINGRGEPRKIVGAAAQSMADGCEVPAYHAALFFNGWLAGFISPYGGTIACGEAANEDTFIEAVQTALVEAKQP